MDKKRSYKHSHHKRKYSSSSSSRPSSSVSISVSASSSSEKVQRYRPKNHDNMVLLLEDLPEEITKAQLEQHFSDAALAANVIPHEEISVINAFGQAYIKYCTVDYARKVLIHLKGIVQIGEHTLNLDFYDDTTGHSKRYRQELKNSLINQPPTSYDWICDKCGYENFAKRHKCNKCLNPRNVNCKILSVMMAPPTGGFTDESNQNTSLMIKAKAIAESTESEILDIFSPIASVKDIRLVKNKAPKDPRMKEQKDFAFVEFYSVEDAENVFRYVTQNEVKLHGDTLIIQYSRSNRSSRYDDFHGKFGGYYGTSTTPTPQQPFTEEVTAPTPVQRPLSPVLYQQPTISQFQQQPNSNAYAILQPLVQAPYQAAQLAQERVIERVEVPRPYVQLPPTCLAPIVKAQVKKQKAPEPTTQGIEVESEPEVEVVVKPKVEKKLTEAEIRKKAELELKKWEKQQQMKKVAEVKNEKVVNKTIVLTQQESQRLILYLCPICRRKFMSEEILTYHVMNSEMHRDNLIKLGKY